MEVARSDIARIILSPRHQPPGAHLVIDAELRELASSIKGWGRELGFQQLGIADTNLSEAEHRLDRWLAAGHDADMQWMKRHGLKRSRPAALVPGTVRVICARMDYLPARTRQASELLQEPHRACISRYALGRDYHKVLRARLQQLAELVSNAVDDHGYRVFVDSAPVMEKPLAENAGLGWIGKHTNLISRNAGSWFFLGEIYTDVPLPVDEPATDHCGTCRACLDVCPTQAIIAPYQLDARRCISYLTIENRGAIPEEFRAAIGNRIFGCDDCQAVCPWNKFAHPSAEADFTPRHGLDEATLVSLFLWDEETWRRKTAGSALRRAGYAGWLRNIAVALGNAPATPETRHALHSRRDHPDPMVREHVMWALGRTRARSLVNSNIVDEPRPPEPCRGEHA
jgi:epoxyqueuosine reductase